MYQVRKNAVLACAVFGFAAASQAHAALVASDVASNSPYSSISGSNNYNGQNGGFGFAPWTVPDTPGGDANGGVFINGTNTDSHNPSPTFDLYDNGNPPSAGSNTSGSALNSSIETATRPFLISLTGAGSSFSFTETPSGIRASNAGTPTSQIGFELLDSTGNVLLNLFSNGTATTGTGSSFSVIDASNNANPYQLLSTDVGRNPQRALTYNGGSGDTITITLNDNIGDYTITSAGHEGSTFADGGQINMSTGGPAAFAFYDNNGGYSSDIRVNGLNETIAPEPASLVLLGFSGASLLLKRRR